MYYAIIADPFHDRGILEDPSLPEGVSFLRGARIDWRPDAPLEFRSNCDARHPPRHCMGGALPVWSDALLNAFVAAGVDNLQPFPAVIVEDGGEMRWPGYNAINVLGLVAAADLTASDTLKIGERPGGLPLHGFQKLVIDPQKTRGLGLFRLGENPLQLVLRGDILDRLAESAPPEGWGVSAEKIGDGP